MMMAVNEQNAAVLQYSGSQIRFERIGGRLMVNATQMAKPFGLTPKDWLRTQQAKDLLNAAAVRQKCLTADLLEVRQGGTPEKQGTWMHEDIALLFAQWLNPDLQVCPKTGHTNARIVGTSQNATYHFNKGFKGSLSVCNEKLHTPSAKSKQANKSVRYPRKRCLSVFKN